MRRSTHPSVVMVRVLETYCTGSRPAFERRVGRALTAKRSDADGVTLGTTAMPARPIHTLRLSPALRDQMVIHLVREAPKEGVGLLAVTRDADFAEAIAWFPGENIDASTTRFTMHPRDVVAAFDTITQQGWELGAIVHSHLNGPASPSRTDLAEAQYPDALMVIVSLAQLPPDVRAWRLDPGGDDVVARRVVLELADGDATGR